MQHQVVSFQSDGIELRGKVYIPDSQYSKPVPALCLCHGIPRGDPPDLGDPGYPALAQRFSDNGFLTIIFNFRGTGDSGGNFDIAGWTRDLVAALDYLCHRSDVDRDRISVMGFSAGAAVSVYVASNDFRFKSIVVCSCPTHFHFADDSQDVDSAIVQFRNAGIIKDSGFPPSITDWIAGFNEVKPIRWIKKISPRPLLIIHGTQDDVVYPSSAQELYERAGDPKQIVMIEGAGHRLRLEKRAMDCALNWLTARNFID
jgi:fermentation-respiration switch protein FrsA (DUF1100 family)